MSIEALGIRKAFGSFVALRDIDLKVQDGEFLALLGPSGSGKTTLLRIIAGLDFADNGTLRLDGEDISRRSARERAIGMVFQHYALFRHMTVFENVAFGLRVKSRATRPSRAEIRDRVNRLLDLVHLVRLADRYPSQLSGGQRLHKPVEQGTESERGQGVHQLDPDPGCAGRPDASGEAEQPAQGRAARRSGRRDRHVANR